LVWDDHFGAASLRNGQRCLETDRFCRFTIDVPAELTATEWQVRFCDNTGARIWRWELGVVPGRGEFIYRNVPATVRCRLVTPQLSAKLDGNRTSIPIAQGGETIVMLLGHAPEIELGPGWHEPEVMRDGQSVQQWMTGTAGIRVAAGWPRTFFSLTGRWEQRCQSPPALSLLCGGHVLTGAVADGHGGIELTAWLRWPAEANGWSDLQLLATPVFSPAQCGIDPADNRTLAIMVTNASLAACSFGRGWYPAESAGDDCWRWTAATAELTFMPDRPCVLLLEVQGLAADCATRQTAALLDYGGAVLGQIELHDQPQVWRVPFQPLPTAASEPRTFHLNVAPARRLTDCGGTDARELGLKLIALGLEQLPDTQQPRL